MVLLSCQSLSVSLATPTNLKKERLLYLLYVTMAILPNDVIVMTRHNGRIDGDRNKYGRKKRA